MAINVKFPYSLSIWLYCSFCSKEASNELSRAHDCTRRTFFGGAVNPPLRIFDRGEAKSKTQKEPTESNYSKLQFKTWQAFIIALARFYRVEWSGQTNIIQQHPTSPNNAQNGWPNQHNIYTQQCWHFWAKILDWIGQGFKLTIVIMELKRERVTVTTRILRAASSLYKWYFL